MPPSEPHDSYTAAQVLVLERLTRIETMIENNIEVQRQMREKAERAHTLSEHHDKEIAELKDANKWAVRTGVVLALGFLANLYLTISQGV